MGSGPGTRGRGGAGGRTGLGGGRSSALATEPEEEAPPTSAPEEALAPAEEKYKETFGETTTGEVEALDRPLTKLELTALNHYQGSGYKNINNFLRGKDSLYPLNVADLENLNSLFDAASLSKDATFYRWTEGTFLKGVTAGSIMRDPGFLSTSRSYSATKHFGDTVLVIRAKRGTKAVDVDKHANAHMGEHEVLFDKGTGLRVTKVMKHGGNTHIFAETVD